jgi:hypothetical protein
LALVAWVVLPGAKSAIGTLPKIRFLTEFWLTWVVFYGLKKAPVWVFMAIDYYKS